VFLHSMQLAISSKEIILDRLWRIHLLLRMRNLTCLRLQSALIYCYFCHIRALPRKHQLLTQHVLFALGLLFHLLIQC
jgi:hypothetical protein